MLNSACGTSKICTLGHYKRKVQKDSPYQILDDTLSCVRIEDEGKEIHTWVDVSHIRYRLNQKKIEVPHQGIVPVLNKLVKEGYIDCEKRPSQHSTIGAEVDHYRMTFEGELLISSGGYALKMKREMANQYLSMVLAWAVALGTATGGVYVLIKGVLWLSQYYEFCSPF